MSAFLCIQRILAFASSGRDKKRDPTAKPQNLALRENEFPRGGVLPYKSDRGACWKVSRTPQKGTRILFYGRVPNSFPPLTGIRTTTKKYTTSTANFNSNKDNFRTLSSRGLFESIVINLYPNQSF